jgi:hypothetical protein
MNFDPQTMTPRTIVEFKIVGQVGTEPDVISDIAELFPDPPRKRHKWGPQKFAGSFVSHSRVSTCACGTERHRQFDYGNHRTVFKTKDGFWHEKTPICTSGADVQAGGTRS